MVLGVITRYDIDRCASAGCVNLDRMLEVAGCVGPAVPHGLGKVADYGATQQVHLFLDGAGHRTPHDFGDDLRKRILVPGQAGIDQFRLGIIELAADHLDAIVDGSVQLAVAQAFQNAVALALDLADGMGQFAQGMFVFGLVIFQCGQCQVDLVQQPVGQVFETVFEDLADDLLGLQTG